MTELRRWKLYLALEGEPRQFIESFTTLKAAGLALRDVAGVKADRLALSVVLDVGQASRSSTRFVCTNHVSPYVIELAE